MICFYPNKVRMVEQVVYGYVPWEVGLGCRVPETDDSFQVDKKFEPEVREKRVMCVSLGTHVEGAVNFWPDTSNAEGALLGVMKRIATKMPEVDEALFDEFFEFSKDFILRNLSECVIPADADLSVETWLKGTNYPAYRIAELMAIYEELDVLLERDFDVDSHIKYESYTVPKHFRGIYSRSDRFKVVFGPICAYIGKIMFHLKWFAKHLDSDSKSERLKECFASQFLKIFSNDFTSFEATFQSILMQIETFFLLFCVRTLSQYYETAKHLDKTKMSKNRLRFRWFVAWLQSKRYSGEMDTSLSNSLVNLLFVCFLLHKSGHPREFYEKFCPPQIEGDDCLGGFLYPLDENILVRLGAKAKIEYFDHYTEASFCGMVFSEETGHIIRDPISCILDFGYVNYQYLGCGAKLKAKLIRAKSLSLLYSYPGCPILRELANYGLRVTSSVSDKHALSAMLKGDFDSYKREIWSKLLSSKFDNKLEIKVHDSSRSLMEKKFGVSVESQHQIEKYLKGLDCIQPIRCEALLDLAGDARLTHWVTHCAKVELFESGSLGGRRYLYGQGKP